MVFAWKSDRFELFDIKSIILPPQLWSCEISLMSNFPLIIVIEIMYFAIWL